MAAGDPFAEAAGQPDRRDHLERVEIVGVGVDQPRCMADLAAEADGVAKFRFWPFTICHETTPMTSPVLFSNGLPLFPGDAGQEN